MSIGSNKRREATTGDDKLIRVNAIPCASSAIIAVLIVTATQAGMADAAALSCGCSVPQQKINPVSSDSIPSPITNTSDPPEATSRDPQFATTTASSSRKDEVPIVAIRIDDMLIPAEDFQAMTRAADSSKDYAAAAAASSSYSPRDYLTCRNLWPNGKLYFRFASDYPSAYKSFIRQSLATLSAKTNYCVTFWESDFYIDIAHVIVTNGNGCWSYIGKVYTYSSQDLSLSVPGCMLESTVQHEFMHALGFIHEQSRIDRDSYVNIWWANILTDNCYNFVKLTYQIPSDFPGYDTTSVMHYTSGAFACATRYSTITIKPNDRNITQDTNLSSTDVVKIRYMYSQSNLDYCASSTSGQGSTSLKPNAASVPLASIILIVPLCLVIALKLFVLFLPD